MALFVLKVEGFERDDVGVRLRPGIPPEAFRERPGLTAMSQGAPFELRRSDGSVTPTRLVSYGVEVQEGEDGHLYLDGPPELQPIYLTVSGDVGDADLSPGTEVWYLDEPGG